MYKRALLLAAMLACAAMPALGQGVGGISLKAFGSRSWRENGAAPGALPTSGNREWDVRLASDLHLYVWTGSEWVDLTAAGSEGAEGPQGPAGPTGPAGAPGATGPQGPAGAQGIQGVAGLDGADGADGATGPQGDAGAAATVAVGAVTTGAPGSSATVENVGSSAAAVLDFAIPRGDTGATGSQGPTGPQGVIGETGPQGPAGDPGAAGPAGPVAGLDTQVIFNDAGAAAGDSDFVWDKTNNRLTARTIVGSTASGGNLTLRANSFSEVANGRICFGSNGASTSGFPCFYYFSASGSGAVSLFDGTSNNPGRYYGKAFQAENKISVDADRNGVRVWSEGRVGFSSDPNNVSDNAEDAYISRDSSGVIRVTDHVKASKTISVNQALNVADNGNGGTRATATLTPTTSYVTCNVADPQGADITLSETGAVDGQTLRIVCTSANVCGFADTTGVTELAGAVDLGLYDSITFLYVTDRFVEVSRSNV